MTVFYRTRLTGLSQNIYKNETFAKYEGFFFCMQRDVCIKLFGECIA